MARRSYHRQVHGRYNRRHSHLGMTVWLFRFLFGGK